MSVEHEYFGVVGGSDGGWWSEAVEFGDQEVEASLRLDGDDVGADALDAAAAVLTALEQVDADVREAFVAELVSANTPTSQFLAHLSDELGPDLIDNELQRTSGDQQLDILRALTLERIELRPEQTGREEHFAELEYSFAADDTDARLIAVVDSETTVVHVSFQA